MLTIILKSRSWGSSCGRGVISHMIVHPITMYVADGFAGFERLLAYLATRETRHLGEVLDAARDARARAGGCEEVRS